MSDEREDPRGPEPTTMRLQAVQGSEPPEPVSESDLADLVTRDSMIGVATL